MYWITIEEIQITTAGSPDICYGCHHNMGFLMTLRTIGKDVAISNVTTYQDERVEFPKFFVEDKDLSNSEFIDDLESIKSALNIQWTPQKLESISIVRDKVIWETNKETWELLIDSGIRLKFRNNLEISSLSTIVS